MSTVLRFDTLVNTLLPHKLKSVSSNRAKESTGNMNCQTVYSIMTEKNLKALTKTIENVFFEVHVLH